MNREDTKIHFEYDYGETTQVSIGYTTEWRVVPATTCVAPINSVSKIECDEKTYYVKAPDSFVIPRNLFHRITIVEGEKPASIWCNIRINIFHGLDLLQYYNVPEQLTGEVADQFRQAILKLNNLGDFPNPVDKEFQYQYYGLQLVKIILDASTTKKESEASISAVTRLVPALKFMQEKVGQNISLANVAATISLSPSRFSVLFNEIMGCAPIAYFNTMRIRRAQELLITTSLSISEIADKLGFHDAYHLSHKFKNTVGLSPKHYRVETLSNGINPD